MCGTSRDSAHKIHTQRSTSTRGMFPAHFTIRAEPGRATPRLFFDVCNAKGLIIAMLTQTVAIVRWDLSPPH